MQLTFNFGEECRDLRKDWSEERKIRHKEAILAKRVRKAAGKHERMVKLFNSLKAMSAAAAGR